MKELDYYLGLKYKIEIEFESEDNSWFACHPELGKYSCYAIGDTIEEALELLEEDRVDFITLLHSEGKNIPEPVSSDEDTLPSGKLVLRLPRTLHQDIKDMAEREGVSINQFIATSMAEKVGKQKVLMNFKNEKAQIHSEYEFPLLARENDIGYVIKEDYPILDSAKLYEADGKAS